MDAFRYIWDGFCELSKACFSVCGGWIPATYVIYKTDTNRFYQLFCFLMMFIANFVGVVVVCGIIAYAYFQIVYAVSSSAFPLQASPVAIIAMVTLAIVCHPVICFSIRLGNIAPAVMLLLCGQIEAASTFVPTITGKEKQRAVSYRSE